jgi:hypothetical protein
LTGHRPHETINTDPGSPPKAALPILAKGACENFEGRFLSKKCGADGKWRLNP